MSVDFEGKTLTAEPSSVGAKHQYDGDKGDRKEPKTASMLWIVGVVAGVVVAGVLVGAVIFVCQRNSKGSEPAVSITKYLNVGSNFNNVFVLF